ncbi:MAG: twin-arginine translocase TatA/TatE family subunit [Chloroflexi bacterium]|nr:twin-arginine translocase TatA/TatE family subunit [Chloroflexota bacterium]
MPKLGPTELIIILVIVLIVFGAGKLANIGGALGKSMKEFRKAKDDMAEVKVEVKSAVDEAKR